MMRTISMRQSYEFLPTLRAFYQGADVLTDLSVVCLWTVLGAALTALFFAMGFSGELAATLGSVG
jgi:hypothetical protein